MTTYRIRLKGSPYNGGEYEEHPVFKRHTVPGLFTWVCLQIGEKQWRWFADSVLEAVKSPFDSGMVYCYPAEPPVHQHWLDVQQARIEWNWKHVYIPADMLGKYRIGKEGADADMSIGVRLCPLWKPKTVISVFAESMRAA